MPDIESGHQSSNDGEGDGDDENGMPITSIGVLGDPEEIATSYAINIVYVKNTSENAYITEYIDFNRDGDFDDPGETSEANPFIVPISSLGDVVQMTFSLPIGGVKFGPTFARIVISDTNDITSSGTDGQGEVEDFKVFIGDSFTCSAAIVHSNLNFSNVSGTGNNVGDSRIFLNAGFAEDGTPVDVVMTINSISGGIVVDFGNGDIDNGQPIDQYESNLGIVVIDFEGPYATAIVNVTISFVESGTTNPKPLNVAFTSGDLDRLSVREESIKMTTESQITAYAISDLSTVAVGELPGQLSFTGTKNRLDSPDSYFMFSTENTSLIQLELVNRSRGGETSPAGFAFDASSAQVKIGVDPVCNPVGDRDFGDTPSITSVPEIPFTFYEDTSQLSAKDTLYIGSPYVDNEAPSLSNDALSDDLNGEIDDEEALPIEAFFGDTDYAITVPIFNNSGETARICGYIDAGLGNQGFDGKFDGSEERICIDVPSNGLLTDYTITWDNLEFDDNKPITFLRLRLAQDFTEARRYSGNGVSVGEVEDYMISVFQCVPPNLSVGQITYDTDTDTYSVAIISNGTVITNEGILEENRVVGIPIGTDVVLSSSYININCATEITIASPPVCLADCTYPELTVGQALCSGTSTYSVAYMENTGAIITVNAGNILDNTISDIPIGVDLEITADNGTESLSYTISSPADCSSACGSSPLSISGTLCDAEGEPTYEVHFIANSSAIITTDIGTVGSNIITEIPLQTPVTITASVQGCDATIVTVPSPECPINEIPETDLFIEKVVDNEQPEFGELITFTIAITNEGNLDVSEVIVEEIIPSGYLFVSYTASAGEYSITNGLWSIPFLAMNTTETLEILVEVLDSGDYLNTATIIDYRGNADDNGGNNSAAVGASPFCLFVYNEFSPNGDGFNETFTIDCIEQYPNNMLEVYNRWGHRVYKKEGYAGQNHTLTFKTLCR